MKLTYTSLAAHPLARQALGAAVGTAVAVMLYGTTKLVPAGMLPWNMITTTHNAAPEDVRSLDEIAAVARAFLPKDLQRTSD